MKRILAALILSFSFLASLSALDTSNPRDDLYTDLDLWQCRGLIQELPHLKPYPIQLVRVLLQEVIRSGNLADQKRAESYLASISDKPVLGAAIFSEIQASQEDYFGISGGGLTAACLFNPSMSVTGHLDAILLYYDDLGVFPLGERVKRDYFFEDYTFSAFDRTVLPTLSMGGSMAFGSDTLWFQAGLHRSSFGPFDEGLVISPSAPQAGHFSFSWRPGGFVYTNYLLALTATRDDGTAIQDNGSISDVPNKYMTGQSFQFFPTSWLELSLFETVIFGERLELYYLLPIISKSYSSIYLGRTDNMMVGTTAGLRLPYDLRLDLMLYFDDLDWLKMLALQLDTKLKMAIQSGISWTPPGKIFRRVSLDYSLVAPYTYTHRRVSITGDDYDFNYVNYTHMGQSLVALDPNSDRLRLQVLLSPFNNLDLKFISAYQRHGNATEDVDQYEAPYAGTSDGGINDNGYDKVNGHNFDENRFLNQDVIEHILQLGLNASYKIPLRLGQLRVSIGYTLELAWNKRDIDSSWQPSSSEWVNGAVPIKGNDVVSNYISFGLSYDF